MSSFTPSPFMQRLLIGLGAIILLLLAFAAGLKLGIRKAEHLSGWCNTYDQHFPHDREGHPSPFQMPFMHPPMMPEMHNIFGKVLSTSGTSMMVQGQNNLEEEVWTTSSTAIRKGWDQGRWEDIHPDENVAVFGAPRSDGSMEAKLIRLFSTP